MLTDSQSTEPLSQEDAIIPTGAQFQAQPTEETSITRAKKSQTVELGLAHARCWLCPGIGFVERNQVRVKLEGGYLYANSVDPVPNSFAHMTCFVKRQRQQREERDDGIWIHRWYGGQEYEFKAIHQPQELEGFSQMDECFQKYVTDVFAAQDPVRVVPPPIHFQIAEWSPHTRCGYCRGSILNGKANRELRIINGRVAYHQVCFFRYQNRIISERKEFAIGGICSKKEQLVGFAGLPLADQAKILRCFEVVAEVAAAARQPRPPPIIVFPPPRVPPSMPALRELVAHQDLIGAMLRFREKSAQRQSRHPRANDALLQDSVNALVAHIASQSSILTSQIPRGQNNIVEDAIDEYDANDHDYVTVNDPIEDSSDEDSDTPVSEPDLKRQRSGSPVRRLPINQLKIESPARRLTAAGGVRSREESKRKSPSLHVKMEVKNE